MTATILWCDECADWVPCISKPHPDVGKFETEDGIPYFLRYRECEEYLHEVWTVEVGSNYFFSAVKDSLAFQNVKKAIRKR